MFDKLKNAFSSIISAISTKEISEKELDPILKELTLSLVECDVAYEVAEEMTKRLKNKILGVKMPSSEVKKFVRESLKQSILELFKGAQSINMFERAKAKKEQGLPFTVIFLGINGTGKTTTLAKVANLFKKRGFSVVVVCGDTHRAGAIEQLKQHASNLGIRTIEQKYGADPAAVARDGVIYAKTHKVDAVLIDTAGRIQTDKNLMEEVLKIVRVVSPDLKIFVGDSLAGNDAVSQSREFLKYTSFDGVILTKTDADVKGGSALSITHDTKKPIMYVCTGQGYDDIVEFMPDKFVDILLSFY